MAVAILLKTHSNPIWIVRRIPAESFSQQPFSLYNSFRIAIGVFKGWLGVPQTLFKLAAQCWIVGGWVTGAVLGQDNREWSYEMRSPRLGWINVRDMPSLYQTAYTDGHIQTLPGEFFPIALEFWMRIILFPFFAFLYILPPVSIAISISFELMFNPLGVFEFLRRLLILEFPESLFILGLILILAVLLGFMAVQGYHLSCELWWVIQERRSQRRGIHHYGLLLSKDELVARILNPFEAHSCLFIPKTAVHNVVWQQIREEVGAKHRRWVYRTFINIQQPDGSLQWIKIKGTEYVASDRNIYDYIYDWWQRPDDGVR